MNIFNQFMMPTQAASAVVLDGSIIIIIGFIALAYLLYKHRKELLDSDEESYKNTVDNENVNIQEIGRLNQEHNANATVNTVTDSNSENNCPVEQNMHMQQNTDTQVNKVENERFEEEEYHSNEKEVLVNYR
ncbi:MAG: hypothetical protein Q4Q22_07195 [Methanosphaera sp.]|nr:hypothetical protein [Methanosphaera sp.]